MQNSNINKNLNPFIDYKFNPLDINQIKTLAEWPTLRNFTEVLSFNQNQSKTFQFLWTYNIETKAFYDSIMFKWIPISQGETEIKCPLCEIAKPPLLSCNSCPLYKINKAFKHCNNTPYYEWRYWTIQSQSLKCNQNYEAKFNFAEIMLYYTIEEINFLIQNFIIHLQTQALPARMEKEF